MFVKNVFFTIVFILSLALVSCQAADPQTVTDFTLLDYNGKSHTLSDIKDDRAIVIMFIATRCPVSNDYNERMVKLYDEYSPKNVRFLAVNSNKQEDAEEVKQHAQENKFTFAVLKDPQNKIADKYDAQVTPEVYVVDTNLELLYHGNIDDSRRENEVETHTLKNALDEILAGKAVTVKDSKAFGCSIKRVN
jgi:peroxiredoxin